MVHEMKLRHIYFEKIRTGEKIYEIRLNDEKRRLISVGDFITFRDESNLDEKMQKRVKDCYILTVLQKCWITCLWKKLVSKISVN